MLNIILFLTMLYVCIVALYRKNKEDELLKPMTFFEKYETYMVVGLFLVGILVRVLWFWEFPAGFNQDEASIGYDAFADVTFGMDRNGDHNPVYSVAWGSGHSSLYISFLHLTIKLFGLSVFSVRIVNVLFGCFGLFAFYGMLKRLRGRAAAFIGLFFMVINPWHIMMCRWGLECNIFPNVFLIGLYFLARGEEKPIFYYISLFLFGVCLYAYGTSYMYIPVFLIIAAIYLLKNKKIKVKHLSVSALIFIITAIPIGIFMMVNFFGLEEFQLSFISFPKQVSGRYNTTVTVLGGSFIETSWNNLKIFFKLLITQSDTFIFNSIPMFGTIYMFSMPFVLLGLFSIIKDKENKGRLLVFSMLPATFVLAALSELNINRANILYVLLIYLAAEGLLFVYRKAKDWFFTVIPVFVIAFCLFTGYYFSIYQTQIASWFFDGFGEAIQMAADETEGTVYLTEHVNGPYVYALFYEKVDPKEFIETVDYMNPNDSVRFVNSFGRFVTGIPQTPLEEKNVAYVASGWQEQNFSPEEFNKTQVGLYYVITPK